MIKDLKLRNMAVYASKVSDINHVAVVPEVQAVLAKWIQQRAGINRGVLIGGLALSFYIKPRTTMDIDLLFLSEAQIPDEAVGFKRIRKGAFQDNKYQVEVEVVYPQSINLPSSVATKVIKTAKLHGSLLVASLEGMIVLKLFGTDNPKRMSRDKADIEAMLEPCPDLDMWEWYPLLTNKHLKVLQECRETVR